MHVSNHKQRVKRNGILYGSKPNVFAIDLKNYCQVGHDLKYCETVKSNNKKHLFYLKLKACSSDNLRGFYINLYFITCPSTSSEPISCL